MDRVGASAIAGLDESDVDAVAEFSHLLRSAESSAGPVSLRTADGRSMTLPPSLLTLLRSVCLSLLQGHHVQVRSVGAELTVEEAAAYIGEDVEVLAERLASGQLARHEIERAVIDLNEMLAFKQRRDEASQAARREMTAIEEESGLLDE